ncbi:hypothetical protein ABPG74_005478 [Tetrahymena malaccensis]
MRTNFQYKKYEKTSTQSDIIQMWYKFMNLFAVYLTVLCHLHKVSLIQSVHGYDCSAELNNFKSNSNIICAMQFFKLKDTTPLKADQNLLLPENCYQTSIISGIPFIGGKNCDFTKPLQLSYKNATYYASRVSVQQKYVVVTSSQCPQSLDMSLSINQFSFSYSQHPPNRGPGFCDYYENNFFQTTDSLNSQTLSISLSCPQYCSSCDNDQKNCFSQIFYMYNSNTFSQSDIQQLEQLSEHVSASVLIGSTFLSLFQNLLSSSSIGLLVNGYICQKYSFLLLLDVIVPQQIYQTLYALKSQYPTQQFTFLNCFQRFINQSLNQYQNQRYQKIGISFDILQKILNGATFEKKLASNFMIINLIFESFLVPTIFIQLSQNWKVALILLMTSESIQLAILLYIRPFQSRLITTYFLIYSILWLGIYIQFTLLGLYSSNQDHDNSQILNILSYTFLVTFIAILLLQPLYMIAFFIVQLSNFIASKRQQKKNEDQLEEILNKNINNKLTNTKQESQFYQLYSYSRQLDKMLDKRVWKYKVAKKNPFYV